MFYSSSNFSYFVEINQQQIHAISRFEGISNFAQRYIETGINQGKVDVTDATFKFEIQEDMDLMKIRMEKDNHEL